MINVTTEKDRQLSRKGRIVYKVTADGDPVGHVISRQHDSEYWYSRGCRYDASMNIPPRNVRFYLSPPELSPSEDKQLYYSTTLRDAAYSLACKVISKRRETERNEVS